MKNQAKILKMPKPKRHALPGAPALEWILRKRKKDEEQAS